MITMTRPRSRSMESSRWRAVDKPLSLAAVKDSGVAMLPMNPPSVNPPHQPTTPVLERRQHGLRHDDGRGVAAQVRRSWLACFEDSGHGFANRRGPLVPTQLIH